MIKRVELYNDRAMEVVCSIEFESPRTVESIDFESMLQAEGVVRTSDMIWNLIDESGELVDTF